ncbi:hypothetical protein [Streptomyces sp. CoH27]|uniref:hypothetical protein n=1 Tax=Streptomyces sp. CoH27 TaxID=2875763 RepID=UPI001CD65805|nr:hypothetical protein [Streptomyces sp. CoH27]
MSDRERPGREDRGQVEFKGDAADNAHVYQSNGDQYISHTHVYGVDGGADGALTHAGARAATLERTHERVSLLITVLQVTEAEWRARCAELAAEAQRARAEGRAEALAEMQEQLRAAELRVMKAQDMMRNAVVEREKAEALLTQAQQELALRRRAEERARTDEVPVSAARLREEGEQFTELLERAEAELGAVRDDLRSLGDDAAGPGGPQPAQVIEGQWTRRSEADPGLSRMTEDSFKTPTPVFQVPTQAYPQAYTQAYPPTYPQAYPQVKGATRQPVPGPPRRFRIGVAWVICAIPPWIPMLVVTANRAAYASDAALWKTVPFTVVTVLLGAAVCGLGLLADLAVVGMLDRDSETTALGGGCALSLIACVMLLLIAFFTPLNAPGPAGAWGRGLASLVGLG